MKKIILIFILFVAVTRISFAQDNQTSGDLIFDIYVKQFQIVWINEKQNDVNAKITFKVNGNSDYSLFFSNVENYSMDKSYMLMTPHPLMGVYMQAELVNTGHLSLFSYYLDGAACMDFKCTIYIHYEKAPIKKSKLPTR